MGICATGYSCQESTVRELYVCCTQPIDQTTYGHTINQLSLVTPSQSFLIAMPQLSTANPARSGQWTKHRRKK